jgi:hypothetical protein
MLCVFVFFNEQTQEFVAICKTKHTHTHTHTHIYIYIYIYTPHQKMDLSCRHISLA